MFVSSLQANPQKLGCFVASFAFLKAENIHCCHYEKHYGFQLIASLAAYVPTACFLLALFFLIFSSTNLPDFFLTSVLYKAASYMFDTICLLFELLGIFTFVEIIRFSNLFFYFGIEEENIVPGYRRR